jgi:hypothetical protein
MISFGLFGVGTTIIARWINPDIAWWPYICVSYSMGVVFYFVGLFDGFVARREMKK